MNSTLDVGSSGPARELAGELCCVVFFGPPPKKNFTLTVPFSTQVYMGTGELDATWGEGWGVTLRWTRIS